MFQIDFSTYGEFENHHIDRCSDLIADAVEKILDQQLAVFGEELNNSSSDS